MRKDFEARVLKEGAWFLVIVPEGAAPEFKKEFEKQFNWKVSASAPQPKGVHITVTVKEKERQKFRYFFESFCEEHGLTRPPVR